MITGFIAVQFASEKPKTINKAMGYREYIYNI